MNRRVAKAEQWSLAVISVLGLGAAAGAALAISIANAQRGRRRAPLDAEKWHAACDESGSVREFPALLAQIQAGGCQHSVRAEVWPVLLQLVDPGETAAAKAERHADLARRFARLQQCCQELQREAEQAHRAAPADAPHAAAPPPPPQAQAVAQRQPPPACANDEALDAGAPQGAQRALASLLCAYAVHDPETGYCQGMSDLAAPFLSVFPGGEDVLAFWAFERLMRRAAPNFRRDEQGIHAQLQALMRVLTAADAALAAHLHAIGAGQCFFAYRMLVVLLRREMTQAQGLELWEALWADECWQQLTPFKHEAESAGLGWEAGAQPDLFLLCVAAVVLRQRRRILADCESQDDAMRLFNSVRVEPWETLHAARTLRRQLCGGAADIGSASPGPWVSLME
ncbi:hypothetical protein WJX81_005364 [Elliptochloris bilobata]|uniref:Rab-GAP TBC domain-containing protein n=1 Tax=Elliptochloris bilobata TaxID=381761 RepID=A0AAW1SE81_9CHLO